jgi:hypothetical protein
MNLLRVKSRVSAESTRTLVMCSGFIEPAVWCLIEAQTRPHVRYGQLPPGGYSCEYGVRLLWEACNGCVYKNLAPGDGQ